MVIKRRKTQKKFNVSHRFELKRIFSALSLFVGLINERVHLIYVLVLRRRVYAQGMTVCNTRLKTFPSWYALLLKVKYAEKFLRAASSRCQVEKQTNKQPKPKTRTNRKFWQNLWKQFSMIWRVQTEKEQCLVYRFHDWNELSSYPLFVFFF